MPEKTLNDLFLAQLKDIYFAEKKIFRTLPKMVKAAKEPELKKAFTTHREETQGQIERLEQVFEMIGKRPQTKPCEAINGIVAEGEETIEDFGDSTAIDTGLVAAGQAVEHYEMARYGALAGWATAARHAGGGKAAQRNLARGNERGKAADANREEQSRRDSFHEGGSVAAFQLFASSPTGGEVAEPGAGWSELYVSNVRFTVAWNAVRCCWVD
jgi:ferritin-like metal-binding protein YciE